MTTYSILFVYADGEPQYEHLTAQTDRGAIRQVREYLKTTPPPAEVQVFLLWHRSTDGQSGYINQNGDNVFAGKPWEHR